MKKNLSFIFLIPSFLIFSIFSFWPILKTFYLSFFDWNMISKEKNFIFLENYIFILKDNITYLALKNTFFYILFLIIFNFILPFILAFYLSIITNKIKNFYKVIFFFPSVISLVSASLAFLWIFNTNSGPITILYNFFYLKAVSWFKTNGLVILLIAIIASWKIFGYNLILLLSGILDVPKELIENAKIDNLSNLDIFIYIILPMTSSISLYVLTLTIIFGLQQVFIPINVLTLGGPNNASTNLIYLIYQYAFSFFQVGRASALAILTTLFFFILLSLKLKILERGVYYEN